MRIPDSRVWWAAAGSLLFFVLIPGTVVGWVPYWLTDWRMQAPPLALPALRIVGAVLVVLGLLGLVDSTIRFAFVGLGTPAPIAPPRHLVVSGPYRHVRNPMYVAILVILVGQALVLGTVVLLRYAVMVWVLFHAFVYLYEEPDLAAKFGPEYETYRKHVGRWWPRVRPWNG